MKANKYLILVSLMVIRPILTKDNSHELTLAESIMIGGTVGAAEVAFPGQPLSYAMNQAIKQKNLNWRHAYKGALANAIGQMPITALQKAVQTQGAQHAQKHQDAPFFEWQKAGISYMTGIAGALIDTSSNAVQLYLQDPSNAKQNTWQAIRALGKNNYRGFWVNSLIKEGPFAVGYQVLAGTGKSMAQKYTDNQTAASIAGGIGAGVITAAITQPGAVIRNKMQAGQTDVIENTIRNEGFRGFYKGLTARGIRIMFAIPLYTIYSSYLEDKVKNR